MKQLEQIKSELVSIIEQLDATSKKAKEFMIALDGAISARQELIKLMNMSATKFINQDNKPEVPHFG